LAGLPPNLAPALEAALSAVRQCLDKITAASLNPGLNLRNPRARPLSNRKCLADKLRVGNQFESGKVAQIQPPPSSPHAESQPLAVYVAEKRKPLFTATTHNSN
jgi:hypothetical protein